jgi:hypothetical protein
VSIRTDILSALRTDLNLTGTKKVWKSVKELNDIAESDFPSIYVGFGTAVNSPRGDFYYYWDVPVVLIVYFSCKTDSDNSGKLETEAERLIGLYQDLESYPTVKAVGKVESLDLLTITPYVNTGVENKGFLLLEYKLTYLGV